MLVLLENLYDYGGFGLRPDADVGMRYLARCAKAGFERGQKVLFRGGSYTGTRVWHQAVSYAAAWLAHLGLLSVRQTAPGQLDGHGLAAALDLCALAQHVKCSPVGGRSHQNATMWTECGRQVLVHEFRILEPRRLIVVGTGDNAAAVRTHVLPGERVVLNSERVRVGRKTVTLVREQRSLNGAPVEALVVPHPAMPGASSRALVDAVARVVRTEL